MKKLFATVLALTMALSLAACGAKEEAPAASAPAASAPAASAPAEEAGITTINPGKLTVATSPDFAPYEFYAIDENGEPQLAGFDMALAQYIADYLGLELEVVPMDFDGTILELQNKKVDLSMAGYSPDPDRADAMDFSDIYISAASPSCAWTLPLTSSPIWLLPTTLITPSAPRSAPSRLTWPMRTPLTPTSSRWPRSPISWLSC